MGKAHCQKCADRGYPVFREAGFEMGRLLGALAGYGSLHGASAQGSQASSTADCAFSMVLVVNSKK